MSYNLQFIPASCTWLANFFESRMKSHRGPHIWHVCFNSSSRRRQDSHNSRDRCDELIALHTLSSGSHRPWFARVWQIVHQFITDTSKFINCMCVSVCVCVRVNGCRHATAPEIESDDRCEWVTPSLGASIRTAEHSRINNIPRSACHADLGRTTPPPAFPGDVEKG